MRLTSFLSVLFLLAPAIQAAVLAIDYGAEFTKLSLVKPGVPLDVVLDRDSKRKIQSVVGWKRDERVFGQEGKMAASRFPETHYPYVKPLLGSTAVPTSPLYPNPPVLNDQGVLVFKHPSTPALPGAETPDEWTPTAILAHQLQYYRNLAESLAGASGNPESITSVIATVPAWWNQAQRKAFRDALELQGLSCLAMIGEGTGVALNYGMTRQFPDWNAETGEGSKEYHLIYDSGAMSTTATVVAFWQTSVLPTPKAKTAINTTHIEVIGTGYELVGGVALDVAIQELLIEDFVQKTKKTGIRSDKRALAKLAKEAVRVKQILSANQESSVNVESLFADTDYRSKLTRQQVEDVLEGSAGAFAKPVASALSNAALSLDDITSVILFGGNTRVPFVQSAIKSVLGEKNLDKIAQNVNTDEAAVLGAAYYGASLSRQFKMKSIDVSERSHEALSLNGEDFFPRGSTLGDRKTIGLKPDTKELVFAQSGNDMLSVEFLNLDSVLANFTSPEPIINLTMRLDARGHLATVNAALVSNATEPSKGMAGAIKGLFGKKDEGKDEDASEDDAEDVKDAKTKEKSKKPEKVAVRFKEHHLGVKPASGEEKRKIMSRLTSISLAEAAKNAREEARNVLESYLYKLSNLLDPDTDKKVLIEFSTDEERDKIAKAVAETFDWMGDHAETASEKELKAKRQAIEKLEGPIVIRFNEMQTRGKAVEDFQQAMFAARTFFVEAHKNNTEAIEAGKEATPENPVAPPKYTEDELKNVETLLKENEVWMDERMKKQVKLDNDPRADPVIMTADLNAKGKHLQMTVLRLVNKKAPKAPKPVKPKKAENETTSEEDVKPEVDTNDTTTEEEQTKKHDEL